MKLCDGCGRHVRAASPPASPTTCPFCGASDSTEIPRSRARGSRTARILAATALVACGGTTEPTGDGGTDGGSKDGSTFDVVDDFSPGPMYGAVIPDAGKDSGATDATTDGPPDIDGIALYGAPPPPKD